MIFAHVGPTQKIVGCTRVVTQCYANRSRNAIFEYAKEYNLSVFRYAVRYCNRRLVASRNPLVYSIHFLQEGL